MTTHRKTRGFGEQGVDGNINQPPDDAADIRHFAPPLHPTIMGIHREVKIGIPNEDKVDPLAATMINRENSPIRSPLASTHGGESRNVAELATMAGQLKNLCERIINSPESYQSIIHWVGYFMRDSMQIPTNPDGYFDLSPKNLSEGMKKLNEEQLNWLNALLKQYKV